MNLATSSVIANDAPQGSPAIVRSISISRRARVALAERDLLFWHEYYFAHHVTKARCDMHVWMAATNRVLATRPGRFIDIGAPQLAKSVLRTRELPIYCVAFDRRGSMTILGNTHNISEHMSGITSEVEENERLQEDFGDVLRIKRDKKKQWVNYSDLKITFAGGQTVKAVTIDQSIRGSLAGTSRVDLLIVDDPQSAQQLENATVRRRHVERFRSEFLSPLSVGKAAVAIVCNNMHPEMIARVMARDLSWTTRFWPVRGSIKFNRANNTVEHVDGPPRFFTDEEIALRRATAGDAVADRDDKCLDVDTSAKIFDSERFWKFPRERVVWSRDPGSGLAIRSVDGDPIEFVGIAHDPSRGYDRQKPPADRKGEVDYAPVVIGGRGKSGTVYVVHAAMLHDEPDAPLDITTRSIREFALLAAHWSGDCGYCENVGFQLQHADALRKELDDRGIPMPVEGVPQSIRKESRIYSLAPRVGSGALRFGDYLDPEYFRQFDTFRLDGKAPYDDAPDATEVLDRNIRNSPTEYAF